MKQRLLPTRNGLIHYWRSLPTIVRVLIRLAVAFAFGLLLAFLFIYVAQKDLFHWSTTTLTVLVFLIPLFLGMLTPFTAYRRNKHLILIALATGLSSLLGAYAYLLPLAEQSDDRVINYYHHGVAIAVALLNLYLICALVLVTLISVITSLIIKGFVTARQKGEAERVVGADKE